MNSAINSIHIKNTNIIDLANNLDLIGDLFIQNGKITHVGDVPTNLSADKVIDGTNLITTAGLVDIAVSLREPGASRKGTIETEAAASLAGGITSLCCTPNTKPVADTPAVIELILDKAKAVAKTKVYPLGALSIGLEGKQLSELVTLRDMGCVAFTNGINNFFDNRLLLNTLQYAATFDLLVNFISQDADLSRGGLAHEGATASMLGLTPISEAAETVALARNLLLVEQSGVRAHFSHITSARGADMIANAKARGLPITADVAIYQLLLNDENLQNYSTQYHLIPPLRSKNDQQALRKAVKEGVIDCIASHHQPHEFDAKNAPFAATEAGIACTQLLLPLTLQLVQEGFLTLNEALRALSYNPAKAMSLNVGNLTIGNCADVILLDKNAKFTAGDNWQSKGRNCPFLGQTLSGLVKNVIIDGNIVI